MDIRDLFEKHYGGKEMTFIDGKTHLLKSDGSFEPIFQAPPVKITESLGKEATESPANISRYSYKLSEISDPFWSALFSYFQNSGFSVFITSQGILQVTTFEGLKDSALSIAKNCIRLSNSSYSHFANEAAAIAIARDRKKGPVNQSQFLRDDRRTASGESA